MLKATEALLLAVGLSLGVSVNNPSCACWLVVAGHVMGLATWKAVLAETGRCPFTKAPLRPDMLTVLTVNNIEKHRSRIVAIS